MKYIVYGENRVMTGDAIAEAVIAYAAALGQNGTTDIVDVPTSDQHGSATTAELLLGPASQLMIETAPDDELEPEDEGLVAELVRRAAAVGGARFVDAASGTSVDEDREGHEDHDRSAEGEHAALRTGPPEPREGQGGAQPAPAFRPARSAPPGRPGAEPTR
jgi:hypothetical protein